MSHISIPDFIDDELGLVEDEDAYIAKNPNIEKNVILYTRGSPDDYLVFYVSKVINIENYAKMHSEKFGDKKAVKEKFYFVEQPYRSKTAQKYWELLGFVGGWLWSRR